MQRWPLQHKVGLTRHLLTGRGPQMKEKTKTKLTKKDGMGERGEERNIHLGATKQLTASPYDKIKTEKEREISIGIIHGTRLH